MKDLPGSRAVTAKKCIKVKGVTHAQNLRYFIAVNEGKTSLLNIKAN